MKRTYTAHQLLVFIKWKIGKVYIATADNDAYSLAFKALFDFYSCSYRYCARWLYYYLHTFPNQAHSSNYILFSNGDNLFYMFLNYVEVLFAKRGKQSIGNSIGWNSFLYRPLLQRSEGIVGIGRLSGNYHRRR